MKFYSVLFASVCTAASLVLRQDESCSTPDGDGTCQDTSTCSGFSEAGYCDGGASNQCCIVQSCSAGGGTGTCVNTANGCSGTLYSGACPGDSSVQCCVSGGGGGGGGGSDLAAFDISAAQSSSFWSCASGTFNKAVIRGYQQACSKGGAVDPNLVNSYNAAVNAGITNIDVYMFPCTGTQSNGVTCKDPQTQVSELESAISDNGLTVTHLWLDIEPASGACNAFNQGSSTNEDVAKQFTSIIRNSQYSWGVYGNGNQWTQMFASRSTDIGSDLPLWAVQADGEPGVSTVDTFMGGWTSAVAKQYQEGASTCGGSVDLDSFSS